MTLQRENLLRSQFWCKGTVLKLHLMSWKGFILLTFWGLNLGTNDLCTGEYEHAQEEGTYRTQYSAGVQASLLVLKLSSPGVFLTICSYIYTWKDICKQHNHGTECRDLRLNQGAAEKVTEQPSVAVGTFICWRKDVQEEQITGASHCNCS